MTKVGNNSKKVVKHSRAKSGAKNTSKRVNTAPSPSFDYKEMLNDAYEKLPSTQEESSRFEIPKVKGHIEGTKTVISNFFQIAKILNRDPHHLLKFILRELATPGVISQNQLILGSKVSASRINEKIHDYYELFVKCPECGKPDTELKKEKGVYILICHACGARHTVKYH